MPGVMASQDGDVTMVDAAGADEPAPARDNNKDANANGQDSAPAGQPPSIVTAATEEERFALELEFVSSLANPAYLHHLAMHGYFDDESFVMFLEYLLYWTKPPYCQHVQYPHALAFLELLQTSAFRAAIKNGNVKQACQQQQFASWTFLRDNAARAAYGLGETTTGVATPGE